MKYYDCSGNVIKVKLLNKVGSGHCGEVYFCNDEWVIKQYFDKCVSDFRLSKEVYEATKIIDSDYIATIGELLYKKPNSKMVDAYTCKYIKPSDINILETDINYMFDNMSALSHVFSAFTELGIQVKDVKCDNTILQDDKIVLIDIDLFQKYTNSNKKLLEIRNRAQTLNLFRALLINCIQKNDYSEVFCCKVYSLFNYDLYDKNDDLVSEVAKKFVNCKYPIDYFIRKK